MPDPLSEIGQIPYPVPSTHIFNQALHSGFSSYDINSVFGFKIIFESTSQLSHSCPPLPLSNEIMKAIISLLAMATAFVCVSTHELRGGPNVSPIPKLLHDRASAPLSFFVETNSQSLLFNLLPRHEYTFESWTVLGCRHPWLLFPGLVRCRTY